MWRLIIKFFKNRSLILNSSLKFLCLGFKLIQIIIFILNTLRGCSMRILNTPRAAQCESYWLTQGDANLIGWFPVWGIFLLLYLHMEASSVALCAFKMSQKLLNAHSKYYGSCSIWSNRCLEQHNRPSWFK
jgi:hypothetical protein